MELVKQGYVLNSRRGKSSQQANTFHTPHSPATQSLDEIFIKDLRNVCPEIEEVEEEERCFDRASPCPDADEASPDPRASPDFCSKDELVKNICSWVNKAWTWVGGRDRQCTRTNPTKAVVDTLQYEAAERAAV